MRGIHALRDTALGGEWLHNKLGAENLEAISFSVLNHIV